MENASIEIKAEDIKIVPIEEIKINPENNNQHGIDQITRLAKLIRHNGFRDPVIISKRSGFVVCGEGRYEAAKYNQMTHIPAIFQDFADEQEEYQFMTAHNEIARWSELDFHKFSVTVDGWDIDRDLFGIEGLDTPKKHPPKKFSISYTAEVELAALQAKFDTAKKSVTFDEADEKIDLMGNDFPLPY